MSMQIVLLLAKLYIFLLPSPLACQRLLGPQNGGSATSEARDLGRLAFVRAHDDLQTRDHLFHLSHRARQAAEASQPTTTTTTMTPNLFQYFSRENKMNDLFNQIRKKSQAAYGPGDFFVDEPDSSDGDPTVGEHMVKLLGHHQAAVKITGASQLELAANTINAEPPNTFTNNHQLQLNTDLNPNNSNNINFGSSHTQSKSHVTGYSQHLFGGQQPSSSAGSSIGVQNPFQVHQSSAQVHQFAASHQHPAYNSKYVSPFANFNLNYIQSLLTKPTIAQPLAASPLSSNTLHSSSVASGNQYSGPLMEQQPNTIPPAASSTTQSAAASGSTSSPLDSHSDNQHPRRADSKPLEIAESLPYGSVCGRQQVVNFREPRVVGGNNTYEGEFPWAVSIQRHGNHHCGGVIVGRRWILTAAHCVRSQLVGNLVVRTGGHTLSRSSNSINSHLERDHSVEQIVMHDDFSRYDNLTSSQTKSSANTNNADIALIKLRHDILWNDLAWPVCFPHKNSGNFSGHDAIVIGWGKLNEKSEDFSNELQKVKLNIIDNKLCQNWFRQAGREMPIDDRIICAGLKSGGKDACHGDSGGPLLSKINGQYAVVGVVSTGIGCARPLLPGLYSRVSSYIDWIERHLS